MISYKNLFRCGRIYQAKLLEISTYFINVICITLKIVLFIHFHFNNFNLREQPEGKKNNNANEKIIFKNKNLKIIKIVKLINNK